ncbi:MAG: leucine-rich repeat protein, partial [Lachnospiraceae bacterium]|nr:leucine-rich repeat protein [Lachnospiraceae bacterium]
TAPAVPEDFKASDNGGTVKLTWSPSASDDCKGYTIYRRTSTGQDYSQIGTVTGRNNLSYTDTAVKKNVKYYYAIEAYDDYSNISEKAESGEISVEDDKEPPVVTSIGPDKSVIGNGSVTIMVKAKDNKAVKSVDLSIQKVNDSNWSTLTEEVLCNEGTALYNLNTAAYEDGDYYICAKARDEEGNVSDEYKKRFTFDNTGISKTTLTGRTISSSVIELVWGQDISESDFAYYSVEKLVRVDDGVPVYIRIAKEAENYNCYISDLVPGEEHTYIVVGYDIYGNRGIESDPITVSTYVDTTGPTITMVSNAGKSYAKIIPLSVNAKDDRALKKAVFKYYNGKQYVEIANVNLETEDVKDYTFIYNWDVSTLDEGKVSVLYEVYDTAGNKNLLTKDGKDVIAEYIIDRTAPGKVTKLELVKNSGSVEIRWNNPGAEAEAEEDKVAGFVVKRVDGKTGKTTTLAENYTALNYIDKTVSVGSTYIYKVAAIDKAGNLSDYSDELKVKVVDDGIEPKIYWIYSTYGDILPINPEIRVLATDNSNLAKLYVEYASADSDTQTWIPLYDGAVSGTEEEKVITWNTDGLTEGKYTVRAYATDAVGLESEYVSKEFTLDLTAPEKPVLNVINGNMYIDLEIEGTVPEDFSRYEIYRREAGHTDFIELIYSGKDKTFRDDEVAARSVYVYQAVIYDVHGNAVWSDEVEGVAEDKDDTAPEAILMSDTITGVVGDEITLFGGNSWDNVGITAYKWYIDGEYIGAGFEIVHKFTEAKVYTLKLEVYDRAGNVGTAEATVVISEKDETGTFTITVKSDKGAPLGNATVYVKEPNGYSSNVRLDNKASISFSKAPGTYQVAAYVNGYLPSEITVNINAEEKKDYVITLKKQELLEASVSVHKLSFAELEMKGVDLSNPANYNTVEVEFDVLIEGHIYHYRTEVSPKNPGRVGAGGGGGSGSSKGEYIVTLVADAEPVIVYYESHPAVSWLNDMYEVNVSILNKASAQYSVDDLTATLNLPQGVSFAALTGKVQTTTINLGSLRGQNRCSASWIVKGNRSGHYYFNVDISGTVMPFETPYNVTATGEADIEVTSGKGLHLFIVVNRYAAIHGDTDCVNYVVVNEGKKEFKNVIISLAGEAIEYNGEGKDVEVDGNKVKIDTLAPHASLSLRAVWTESYGTPIKESDLDYHINYIRGKNLGMEITVVEELPDLYYKDGTYGDIKWKVQYGVLTVEGKGNYADSNPDPSQIVAPWHDGETEKHIGMAEIDVENMTFTTAMFEDCINLKSFNFKNGTDKVTNMSRMFKNCTSLSSVKMGQLKSSAVTDLSYMFMGCTSLSYVGCLDFSTSSVTNISGMFKGCKILDKLDLSSWNFSNVNTVNEFFLDCSSLAEVYSPRNLKNNSSLISLKESSKARLWYVEDGDEEKQTDYFEKVNNSERYISKLKVFDDITVSFDVNGGDGEQYVNGIKKTVRYGLPYGELPKPTAASKGLVFRYWTTKSGTPIYEDTIVDITTDHTLYAQWVDSSNIVTVSFNANGGYGQQYLDGESKTVIYGEAYGELPAAPAAPQGKQFDGWYTAKVGGGKVTSNTKVGTSTDHTLYAHWKVVKSLNENYILVTDDMGGVNYYPYYKSQYNQLFTDDTYDCTRSGKEIYGYDHVRGTDEFAIDSAEELDIYIRAQIQAIPLGLTIAGKNLYNYCNNTSNRKKLKYPNSNEYVDYILNDANELLTFSSKTRKELKKDVDAIFNAAFEVLNAGDSFIIASSPDHQRSFSYSSSAMDIAKDPDYFFGINATYKTDLLSISFDGSKYRIRYKWYVSDYYDWDKNIDYPLYTVSATELYYLNKKGSKYGKNYLNLYRRDVEYGFESSGNLQDDMNRAIEIALGEEDDWETLTYYKYHWADGSVNYAWGTESGLPETILDTDEPDFEGVVSLPTATPIPSATRVGVNCPVDIKVYDSTDSLVGYIKDNVPQSIEGGIKAEVDENEQKLVYLNGGERYKLEIIATDDGEVTVFTQTYDINTEEVSSVWTYSDMKVKRDEVINVDILPVIEYTTTEDVSTVVTPVWLVINESEEVKATTFQNSKEIVSYTVTAGSSNAEAGTVTGGGSFYNGEFCKVTATAKDGYEFKGWMEDGKLVSSDAEYRFEINTDHNITAEFTKKNTTEGGNSGSGNSGSGNSGGSSGGYSGGGSSGGYSGGGSSGGYSGGGSSGGVSGGGSAGGTSGGVSGGSTGGTTGGGTTGTGNTGNGGSGKTDGKDGDTSKEFELKVGAVYTDENGIRYSITAIKGTKKATANTVKYIGPEKSSVKKIVIPNTVTIEGTTYTVTELDTSWTKGNKKLTTVVINDNIKKIPTDAFNGCKALKSITFGAKVTTIGTRAFYNCAKLKTVKLPAKLTKIGSKAFYGCSALESITIPSKVESISSYAFYRCKKLYKVTIKSKLLTDKKIGKKVFSGIVTNAVIKVPKAVVEKYAELLKKAGVTKKMTVTK